MLGAWSLLPERNANGVRVPTAAVVGVAGVSLTGEERALFAEGDPLGFILFKRNCDTPAQVATLVAELRAAVGRPDAPILIDQEGGRVQRLTPPCWRLAPPAAVFDRLADRSESAAVEATWLNARLIAAELAPMGITHDCWPLLDVRRPDADPIIGDRAFGGDPVRVAMLGRAAARGLLAGGIVPIVKHIPGHGRAMVDSHRALPVVDVDRAPLAAIDFAPFAAMRDMPWAMTAHVVYAAIDPDYPATTSHRVIREVIRSEIGFDGVLVSDDVCMNALSGTAGERARAAIDAGCDLVLHCNGVIAETAAVLAATPKLASAARRRLDAAAMQPPPPVDTDALQARLAVLLDALVG